LDTIVIINWCLIACSLVFSIIAFYYTRKTKKRYEKIALKLGNGEDITSIIGSYIDEVENLKNKDEEIINYFGVLNKQLGDSIQKVGLYKYNAYNNTKNKLSFALALLNRENTGIILNSIYGVDDSNIYAKPIIKGKSKINLSSEEEEAIKIAIEQK